MIVSFVNYGWYDKVPQLACYYSKNIHKTKKDDWPQTVKNILVPLYSEIFVKKAEKVIILFLMLTNFNIKENCMPSP